MEDNVQLFKDMQQNSSNELAAGIEQVGVTCATSDLPPDPGEDQLRAMCSVCARVPQTFKYQECCQLLCAACKDLHLRFESSRSHSVIEYDEALEEQRLNLREIVTRYEEVRHSCDVNKTLVVESQEKLTRDAEKHKASVMEVAQMLSQCSFTFCATSITDALCFSASRVSFS